MVEALLVADDLDRPQRVGAEVMALEHLTKAALAQNAKDLWCVMNLESACWYGSRGT